VKKAIKLRNSAIWLSDYSNSVIIFLALILTFFKYTHNKAPSLRLAKGKSLKDVLRLSFFKPPLLQKLIWR